MKRCASDYLPKPFEASQVLHVTRKVAEQRQLERRIEALQTALGDMDTEADLPTTDPAMQSTIELSRQVAQSQAYLIIHGEVGVGKGRLAHAIHIWSGRAAQPFVADAFPAWAHIIFGSGITLGALSAIILNVVFNHLGAPSEAVAGTPNDHLVTLAEVNTMSQETFNKTFGNVVENSPWVLERTFAMRPFADTMALRTAFHEVLLTGTMDQQMQLMNSFADLGDENEADDAYMVDHVKAGIDGLAQTERDEVRELAAAYRKHFGFPLIICAREMERYGRVLSNGWYHMANSPNVERSAALIEIAKIANYRLDELVANANPITSAQLDRFTRMAA